MKYEVEGIAIQNRTATIRDARSLYLLPRTRTAPFMIRRLLIANRGEIALRIIHACRELGIESVAVFSDADRPAPHVVAADRSVHIGPAPATDSYLNIPRLIDAARAAGADAVHPGYGFLSENPAFAEACATAGLTFVGPPAAVIARMGSKIEARRIVAAAGVPVVPGETPEDQSDAGVRRAIDRVGLPALIKASAGGGGKGMREVRDAAGIDAAIQAARREGIAAFADGTLYVERLIDAPRHVEIQILADDHGNVVHLFERECSVQRRHQKVIEESPSLALTPELRARMTAAAVAAARAANYRNAGTIEFLVDGSIAFFPRDEHAAPGRAPGDRAGDRPGSRPGSAPRRIGATAALGAGRDRAARPRDRGARVRRGSGTRFLPQAGRVLLYREPRAPGVRVDSGVVEGGEVSVYYDPLIAKVIATAETRELAIARLVVGACATFPFSASAPTSRSCCGSCSTPTFPAGARHELSRPSMRPRSLSRRTRCPQFVRTVANGHRGSSRRPPRGIAARVSAKNGTRGSA